MYSTACRLQPLSQNTDIKKGFTLLRLRLAWMPLSLIFTVICRSVKSGLRKGDFTLTDCFFFGSTMYLIDNWKIFSKNKASRHTGKKDMWLTFHFCRSHKGWQTLVKFYCTEFVFLMWIIRWTEATEKVSCTTSMPRTGTAVHFNTICTGELPKWVVLESCQMCEKKEVIFWDGNKDHGWFESA